MLRKLVQVFAHDPLTFDTEKSISAEHFSKSPVSCNSATQIRKFTHPQLPNN